MIFLYLIAGLTGIITFALQLLPDESFLPFPAAATAAVATAGQVGGWVLGLAGEDIKNALTIILPLVALIKLVTIGWSILRHWRPPGMARTV